MPSGSQCCALRPNPSISWFLSSVGVWLSQLQAEQDPEQDQLPQLPAIVHVPTEALSRCCNRNKKNTADDSTQEARIRVTESKASPKLTNRKTIIRNYEHSCQNLPGRDCGKLGRVVGDSYIHRYSSMNHQCAGCRPRDDCAWLASLIAPGRGKQTDLCPRWRRSERDRLPHEGWFA